MEVGPLSRFVKRPGLGRVGNQIKVRTNYYAVTLPQDEEIIHYDVMITPEVPPKLNRIIFARFVETTQLRGILPVFDGTYFFCKFLNIE